MFGITLKSTAPAAPFWEHVDAASALEPRPSIRALDYAPHITLARYEDIDPVLLTGALAAFNGEAAFALTFDAIRTFDGDEIVLWLSPQPDERLFEAHARLHDTIAPLLCDPHYRPGAWTPHLTIAAAVPAGRREDALRLAGAEIAPFTLAFDAVDCLSWPPVTVLAEHPLS